MASFTWSLNFQCKACQRLNNKLCIRKLIKLSKMKIIHKSIERNTAALLNKTNGPHTDNPHPLSFYSKNYYLYSPFNLRLFQNL